MKTKILYLLSITFLLILLTTSCAQTYGYGSRNYGNYDVNTSDRIYQRGVTVEAENPDVSYNLDLRAVANVFADSRDLEEFEMRINDYETAINNLDLNYDGQVDYLRVIETRRGNTHLVVLQAVLDYDTYQDVASIAVERRGRTRTYVQIIGDPFIYGPRYIIEPVYVYTPTIFSFFWGPSYHTWHSPYYWGYYPRHYHFWNPIPYRVYANNVNIYIDNSRHTYNYADNVRSNNYATLHNSVSRSDLARQRPDRSFASRNARANVNNRRDLDAAYRTSSRSSRGEVDGYRSSSRSSRSGVNDNNRMSSRSSDNRTMNSSGRSSQINSSTRERSTNTNRNVRSNNSDRNSRYGNYNSGQNRSSGNVRSSRSDNNRYDNYNSGASRSSSNRTSSDVRTRSSRDSNYSNERNTDNGRSSVNRSSRSSRTYDMSPTRSNSSSRNSNIDRSSRSESSRSSSSRVSSDRSGNSSSRSSGVSSSRNDDGNSRSSSSRSSRSR